MKVKHRSSGSKLILHRAATTKQELIAGRGSLLLRIKVPASVPAGVELTLQLKYAMTGLLVNDPGEWNQSSWTYVVDMDGVSTCRAVHVDLDQHESAGLGSQVERDPPHRQRTRDVQHQGDRAVPVPVALHLSGGGSLELT
jgi:hypothetical protein